MKIYKKSAAAMLVSAFFILSGFTTKALAQEKFEKAAFYRAMEAGNMAAVNNELTVVENSSRTDKNGYAGALLMRKAGLALIAQRKLKFFKEGRVKLETALINEPNSVEFHFLRLTIQENAPKIVKYHADIEKDKAIVIKNFKSLQPSVQHAILNYCKKSEVLHAEDF